jgi:hypothetical protein
MRILWLRQDSRRSEETPHASAFYCEYACPDLGAEGFALPRPNNRNKMRRKEPIFVA